MQKNILIVDDHPVIRTGVSIILEEKFKHLNIATTENYTEFNHFRYQYTWRQEHRDDTRNKKHTA